MAHLCISDTNKMLLVQSAEIMPLLMETLLLDDGSSRQDQELHVKQAIQRDSAECFLQLALFDPGREMLLENTASVQALHALADGKALTEEVSFLLKNPDFLFKNPDFRLKKRCIIIKQAKLSAHGALLAIGAIERTHEPEPVGESDDEGDLHVMLSCKSHATPSTTRFPGAPLRDSAVLQINGTYKVCPAFACSRIIMHANISVGVLVVSGAATIVRVVRSLQQRGYKVWFGALRSRSI